MSTYEEYLFKQYCIDYENYHKHTADSNVYVPDSTATYQDYFDRTIELGGKCITTVEHGWCGNNFDIYLQLEKFNKKLLKQNKDTLKFVFGGEFYWVKDRLSKDDANCHIVLLARNENGRKKINKIMSQSNKDGYHYRPRIDLKLLFTLPKDDVMVTTACVAFWKKYDDIDEIVLKLNDYFPHFFLEVQTHNTDLQKKINKHIIELHNEYHIPIIAGMDSHMIDEKDAVERDDLLRSKKMFYDDEEGWYMDYPSGEVAVKRFIEQGILTNEEINEAMGNTLAIRDFEDIIYNKDLKVPVVPKYKHLSLDERVEIFKQLINQKWIETRDEIDKELWDKYLEQIRYEVGEILGCDMSDYFQTTYETIQLGINKYKGTLTKSGRGSGASAYVNKLLGFTDVDRIASRVTMFPERFMTKERILESHTPPDIDHNISDREPFKKAQEELLGSAYDLIAFGTLHFKSAWKMYARAYDVSPSDADIVSKQISKYEDKLKHAERDEVTGELLEDVNIHDFVEEKYWELLEGCKKYLGIKDTRKGHPCFLGYELVMTNKGYKQIKDVKIGDYVLTHNNRFMEVKKVMKNRSSDIYELSGDRIFKIKATGNHPFYTIDNRLDDSTPKWIDLSKLKKGNFVGIAINNNSKLPLSKFNLPFEKKSFWKEVGICLKNGLIDLGDNCKSEEFIEYVNQFKEGLSNDILDLPINLLKSLIEGCFEIVNNEHIFNSSNKELILGLSACVNKAYHKQCIVSDGMDSIKFSITNKQDTCFYKDGYIWCKVGDVKKLNLTEDTYNLSVIDDNSYTINNIIVHNCGTIATDLNVEEEIGVILCKSESTKKEVLTACIESGNIDYFGWLKQDFLVVDVVGTTQAVYDRIGIKSHTVKELLEITNGDKKTWDIYAKGLTMCVNQVEKPSSRKKTMQYKPINEVELCALIAGIRPSFASLLKTFLKREEFNYGIKSLDELVQTPEMPYTFILYQEQLMQILGYAGFPMKETYDIIKSVSKKKRYCRECGVVGNSSMKSCPHCGSSNIAPLVDKFKAQFVKGFSDKIKDSDNKEEVASNVWHIVEDFAGYGFNASHSYCMAIDSLNQAYLKAHYPLAFYETMLRRYTEKGEKDKVRTLKEEMLHFNIRLGELKFGEDNRNFIMDEETNTITQSLVAIKGVSQIVANEIYDISKRKDEFNNFIELRHAIKKECRGIKKNQLESLIEIGYFSDYGCISYLKKCMELYESYYTRKTYKKTGTEFDDVIRNFANKETEKQFAQLDNLGLINYYLENEFNYISIIEKALVEFRSFGEITIKDEEYNPTTCIVVDVEDKWKIKKVVLYNIRSGKVSEQIRIGEMFFLLQPIAVGDVMEVYHTFDKVKKKQVTIEVEDDEGNVTTKKRYIPQLDDDGNTMYEKWCDEYQILSENELDELIKEEYNYKYLQN